MFWEKCLVVFILKLSLSVSSMEETSQLSSKRISLQTELTVSILVVVKCPWFILLILMTLHSEGLSCYHCQQQQWIASTINKVCHLTANFLGNPVLVHHAQPFIHNSYSNKSLILVDQNHTNLRARALEEKPASCSLNWSPQLTPSIIWWYSVTS